LIAEGVVFGDIDMPVGFAEGAAFSGYPTGV
jgi:hypothetical protein